MDAYFMILLVLFLIQLRNGGDYALARGLVLLLGGALGAALVFALR
jgi:hypothetical protein